MTDQIINAGKKRKALTPMLKRKAQAISLRKTNVFYIAENIDAQWHLIPVEVLKASTAKNDFQNWDKNYVQLYICQHHPDGYKVRENILIQDLLIEGIDQDKIDELVANKYIVGRYHDI